MTVEIKVNKATAQDHQSANIADDSCLSSLSAPSKHDKSLPFWKNPALVAGAAFLARSVAPDVAIASEAFVPNDPYFYATNTPGFNGQWYLDKQGTEAKIDLNVRGAWSMGLTGKGVTIGFVDVGVDWRHPDLNPNYDPTNSWDFYQNDSDPSPSTSAHGTACAGLACARGGNGIGVTGVAPSASFAALKANMYPSNLDVAAYQQIADALSFHSTGVSRNIQIKNLSWGENGCYISLKYPLNSSLVEAAINDSAHSGTIHVSIAGNGRVPLNTTYEWDGDANRKLISHLPGSIVVSAVSWQGKFSGYSAYGANVTVCAPSGETIWAGGQNLLTTDISGLSGYNPAPSIVDGFPDDNYTSVASGTSSATPLISGVIALAKEAHGNTFGSNLIGVDNARYYKHLIAKTSRVIDIEDSSNTGGWQTNSAGFHFNNNYGFGLIDATAMAQAAATFSGVTPLATNTTGSISMSNVAIPLGDTAGISRSFTITNSSPLEEVLVRLKINTEVKSKYSGTYFGQIQVNLTSPTGTKSTLALANPSYGEIYSADSYFSIPFDWTFIANAFWGENPSGEWTLTVSHPYPANDAFDDDYYFASFEVITRSGELIKPLAPVPLTIKLERDNVIVSWPEGTVHKGLFRTVDLNSDSWEQVLVPEGASSISLPISEPIGFFRLKL